MSKLLERLLHPFRSYEERETVDHLAGAEHVGIIRPRSMEVARERTLRTIQAHGPDSATASEALRRAADRHFGSWTKALTAAGMGFGATNTKETT